MKNIFFILQNRKRIPFIDEDSDTHSLGKSSTSGTLGHDAQIFRSRPVVLKRPEVSANNKLVPDSTTRTLARKPQNNFNTENLVSQNTANVGSVAENSCNNEIQDNLICNLDSAVKSVRNDLCRSCHNVANSNCGMHSHIMSHKAKCCGSRVSCCNCHITPGNHCKENTYSCNYRSSCACFNNHHCSCIRNSCCAHNAVPQCMHWNSAHSCRTDNSSCNKHFDHQCRPMQSCCGPCHSQIMQCCTSYCQSGCKKSKCFRRQTNVDKTSTSCCNKQISASTHCHNLCCCNHHKINTSENVRASHCCASRNESNSKQDNANEEISVELSEDSNIKSRTKEWVHNWVGDPPHLLPDDIEASEHLGTSSKNPSLESSVVEAVTTCSNRGQSHLVSSNPTDCVSKNQPQKHVKLFNPKKIKLFNPINNSSIISEKSIYCNATIIEESTPYDSENHTDTPRDPGLSSGKNQEPDKNVTKNINLPLSNNIGLHSSLDATDPPAAKELNNSMECARERLHSETNRQELPITNHLQNKEALSSENKNSSEEQFPELWIETPIISQTGSESQINQNRKDISNKLNQSKSCKSGHDEVSCSNYNINSNQQSMEKNATKEINPQIEKNNEGSNKESSPQKACDVPEMECDGKNDSGSDESSLVITHINENNKDSPLSKSLALQDHSKSRDLCNDKEMDSRMDITLMSDKTIDKEGMKRSKESSDDAMELTCESMLMKRRKKEKFRKTRSVGSLSTGRNINEASISSSDTYYDARSDGILSLRSNKWCLKPIKEVFDKPLCRKVIFSV